MKISPLLVIFIDLAIGYLLFTEIFLRTLERSTPVASVVLTTSLMLFMLVFVNSIHLFIFGLKRLFKKTALKTTDYYKARYTRSHQSRLTDLIQRIKMVFMSRKRLFTSATTTSS